MLRLVRALAAISLVVVSLQGSSASSQELERLLPPANAQCDGTLPKRFQRQPWDFTTNSKAPSRRGDSVFLHCIFNNDPKNVLDVNWFIPGVKETIPGNTSALSPRYSWKLPLGSPDGCLVFGNLLDRWERAQFWARQEDKDRLDREKGQDCKSLKPTEARADAGKLDKAEDTVAPFRMFLRADAAVSTSALIAFEGITGVRIKDSRTYQSYVTYRLRDENGNPPAQFATYFLAPRWSGPAEVLAKSFYSYVKGPIVLESKKEPATIFFNVEGTGDWDLQELEYAITDNKGRVSGSFFAPVLISLPPR